MATRLIPVSIPSPGNLGLNTQSSAVGLGPEWGLFLDNVEFDNLGRIAARKGLLKVTTSAIASKPTFGNIFEYRQTATTSHIISGDSTNGKLYSGTTTLTDITGSLSFTNKNWQFANLNGRVIAVTKEEFPIYWTGSSNFDYIHNQHSNWAAATAYALGDTVKAVGSATKERYFVCTSAGTSAGSEPTFPSTEAATVVDNGATWTTVKMPKGNCILSAFGRLWAADSDKTTIRFSALNNEKLWDTTNGGGTIDLVNNFAFGKDEIIALSTFNNQLIVFGKTNITIFNSPVIPTSLALADSVVGMGCVARDTVQTIGSDLLFLSGDGLRSLSRTIELEKMPAQDFSQNIRTDLLSQLSAANKDNIKSCWSEKEGFYLLKIGTFVYNFDFKKLISSVKTLEVPLPKISRWLGMEPDSLFVAKDETVYFGKQGFVAKYSGYNDSLYSDSSVVSSTYNFKYRSNWQDFGFISPEISSLYKMPKKIKMTVNEGTDYTINYFWAFDYINTEYRQAGTAILNTLVSAGAQWGTSEWNLGEWSGDATAVDSVPAQLSGSGQNLQYGFDVTVNGSNIAIQQIELLIKLGRVAR